MGSPCREMMNKSLSVLLGFLCTSLTVIGCETSNQDYSHSSRVINATTTPRYQTSGVAQDRVYIPGQGEVYASNNNASYNNALLTVEDSSLTEPATQIVVYDPNAQSQNQNQSKSSVQTRQVSSSEVGVVKPYIPTEVSQADTYQVVKGDTLYSIAFRYGLDYKTLAKNNGIEPPYNIAVGQLIKLDLKKSQATPTYTVKKGDTLYSIAKANGQSVAFLAGVNDLKEPYNLKVGQVLDLARNEVKGQSSTTVIPVAGQTQKETDKRAEQNTQAASVSSQSVAQNKNNSPKTQEPVIVKGKTRKVSGITWMWPTQGKIIEQFSLAEQGNKGIDISGSQGQAVLAAADGQVVYAGNALRGYGNLIIINHSDEFLSAYAHNDALLVSEGQKVVRGQQVARMGSTDAKSTRLHFEIRYRGQSVNPLSYLPK